MSEVELTFYSFFLLKLQPASWAKGRLSRQGLLRECCSCKGLVSQARFTCPLAIATRALFPTLLLWNSPLSKIPEDRELGAFQAPRWSQLVVVGGSAGSREQLGHEKAAWTQEMGAAWRGHCPTAVLPASLVLRRQRGREAKSSPGLSPSLYQLAGQCAQNRPPAAWSHL